MRVLSQKTKYALRALQYLALRRHEGPVLISDLSEDEKIPRKFLELILLELKNNGLLQSKKGKGGGYALRKAPAEITLGQVIRLFDGPVALMPCVSESAYSACPECHDEAICGTRFFMKEVRDATAKILDGTTIADVLSRSQLLESKRALSSPATGYQI